jgi:hypothetical protein
LDLAGGDRSSDSPGDGELSSYRTLNGRLFAFKLSSSMANGLEGVSAGI